MLENPMGFFFNPPLLTATLSAFDRTKSFEHERHVLW